MSGSTDALPVSVVIPCYRCAATIRRAVSSVLAQSCLPRQLILVDDCSNDGGETRKALRAIRDEAGHAVLVDVLELTENGGPGAARNAGWEAATEEWIAFLDADDSWHPRKLELQMQWMRDRAEFGLTCHRSHELSAPVSIALPVAVTGDIKGDEIHKIGMLVSNRIAMRTVMLRRELCQRFPKGMRRAEDYWLWLQMLGAGVRMARLEAPLAYSYKADFGQGGLSADLVAMHRSVLECFSGLRHQAVLSAAETLFAVAFEHMKFQRRRYLRWRQGRKETRA